MINHHARRSLLLYGLIAHILLLVVGVPLYMLQFVFYAIRAEARWAQLIGLYSSPQDSATAETIKHNLGQLTRGEVHIHEFPGWYTDDFAKMGLLALAVSLVLGIEVIVLLICVYRKKKEAGVDRTRSAENFCHGA